MPIGTIRIILILRTFLEFLKMIFFSFSVGDTFEFQIIKVRVEFLFKSWKNVVTVMDCADGFVQTKIQVLLEMHKT